MKDDQHRAAEAAYITSPIHKALGLVLKVDGEGGVRILYAGGPNAVNRSGNIAGGALAQMIDSAVVQACKSAIGPEDKTATLELKVNYLRPAPKGEGIVTTGTLEHLGRTTAVGIGRAVSDSGKLIALGTATVSIRRAAG